MSAQPERNLIGDWVKERNEALVKLDLEWARKAVQAPKAPDETLLAALHKARYEVVTGIPDELRHESRRWLEERNYGRFGTLPWPPAGELP